MVKLWSRKKVHSISCSARPVKDEQKVNDLAVKEFRETSTNDGFEAVPVSSLSLQFHDPAN